MSNLMDYLAWRGDLPFEAVPFDEVDAAVCSMLCYLSPGEKAMAGSATLEEVLPDMLESAAGGNQYAKERAAMAEKLPGCPRYAGLRIRAFINRVDMEEALQFSAMVITLPGGDDVVAFRGTDSTLAGWEENFVMCYETPVPAQSAAAAYLAAVAETSARPLWAVGHSKGGNLAVYAAAHTPPEVRARLKGVYSLDGPGLDEETLSSAAYRSLEGRLHALIPQGSIIGLLMGYHSKYTIVRSSAGGLQQHDVFSWQVERGAFLRESETSFSSQTADSALHDWLRQASPRERRVFVTTVFDTLKRTGATTTAEIRKDPARLIAAIGQTTLDLDPETRRMVLSLFGQFVALGAASALNVGLKMDWARALENLLTPKASEANTDAGKPAD